MTRGKERDNDNGSHCRKWDFGGGGGGKGGDFFPLLPRDFSICSLEIFPSPPQEFFSLCSPGIFFFSSSGIFPFASQEFFPSPPQRFFPLLPRILFFFPSFPQGIVLQGVPRAQPPLPTPQVPSRHTHTYTEGWMDLSCTIPNDPHLSYSEKILQLELRSPSRPRISGRRSWQHSQAPEQAHIPAWLSTTSAPAAC